MKPSHLMIWGAFVGIAFATISTVTGHTDPTFTIVVFAGGALFGKGYGIWEERERR